MSLKFLNDIRAEINSLFADNNTGAITPASLRTVVLDMVDSLFSRSAALVGVFTAPGLAQLLNTTPTVYPGFMPTPLNNNPGQFTVNAAAGTITILVGGFSVNLIAEFSLDAPNAADVVASIYKNGVIQQTTLMQILGTGVGDVKAGSVNVVTGGVLANDVFDLRFAVLAGTATVNVRTCQLVVQLNPTQSAI